MGKLIFWGGAVEIHYMYGIEEGPAGLWLLDYEDTNGYPLLQGHHNPHQPKIKPTSTHTSRNCSYFCCGSVVFSLSIIFSWISATSKSCRSWRRGPTFWASCFLCLKNPLYLHAFLVFFLIKFSLFPRKHISSNFVLLMRPMLSSNHWSVPCGLFKQFVATRFGSFLVHLVVIATWFCRLHHQLLGQLHSWTTRISSWHPHYCPHWLCVLCPPWLRKVETSDMGHQLPGYLWPAHPQVAGKWATLNINLCSIRCCPVVSSLRPAYGVVSRILRLMTQSLCDIRLERMANATGMFAENEGGQMLYYILLCTPWALTWGTFRVTHPWSL